MSAYYNENDPKMVAWLRELIKAGLIPAGDVDDRSITDVYAPDLRQYGQHHFFAGIGGWCEALRLAGWPQEREVWTGSCPCQPFSAAGKRKGKEDERHLWPAFLRLITECRPICVFGEQVASKLGREWLAGVFTDLEALGYACGGADLCAAGVAAPHIRQRLWWVAHATSGRCTKPESPTVQDDKAPSQSSQRKPLGQLPSRPQRCSGPIRLANTERDAGEQGRATNESREGDGAKTAGTHAESGRCGDLGGLGDTYSQRQQEQSGAITVHEGPGRTQSERPSFWTPSEYIPCADGKARRVEPGIAPLAHGIPGRVAQLRGLGNAICPQIAAEFIRAYMETE